MPEFKSTKSYTTIKGQLGAETFKAILIENISEINGIPTSFEKFLGDRKVLRKQWFPKSAVTITKYDQSEIEIEAETWICKSKGLEI